jgi:hypothetical protein
MAITLHVSPSDKLWVTNNVTVDSKTIVEFNNVVADYPYWLVVFVQ